MLDCLREGKYFVTTGEILLEDFTVNGMLLEMPLTHDLSAWYAGSTWVTLLVIAALTAWGFYVALAGRPVFNDALAGEPGSVRQ